MPPNCAGAYLDVMPVRPRNRRPEAPNTVFSPAELRLIGAAIIAAAAASVAASVIAGRADDGRFVGASAPTTQSRAG